MKKYYKKILTICLIVASIFGGTQVYYHSIKIDRTESAGHFNVFKDLNTLSNTSQVIIEANVESRLENDTVTYLGNTTYKYPVKISKIIKNSSEISDESLEELSILISANLHGIKNVDTGKYLLFLKVSTPSTLDQPYFILSSPRNLYKKTVVGYTNITDNSLSKILSSSIDDLVNKYKKN